MRLYHLLDQASKKGCEEEYPLILLVFIAPKLP